MLTTIYQLYTNSPTYHISIRPSNEKFSKKYIIRTKRARNTNGHKQKQNNSCYELLKMLRPVSHVFVGVNNKL